jgi:hypothetical protein
VPVLFLLSEFAQLGKVAPIRAAFGQARKYGLRMFPVLQNWGQLIDIYGQNGALTFLGNSGCLIGFNPGNDSESAEMLSKLSDEHGVVMANASPDPQAPGGVRAASAKDANACGRPAESGSFPNTTPLSLSTASHSRSRSIVRPGGTSPPVAAWGGAIPIIRSGGISPVFGGFRRAGNNRSRCNGRWCVFRSWPVCR